MFTPDDSLVFGGNFIHSFNIPGQIKISEIEDNTKVNVKYSFAYLPPPPLIKATVDLALELSTYTRWEDCSEIVTWTKQSEIKAKHVNARRVSLKAVINVMLSH